MDIVPFRKPQQITYSQYERYTPEKIELIKGNLLYSEQERIDLLMLLLYNVGLETFIQHLPKESVSELKSLLENGQDSMQTGGLKRTKKRSHLQPHTTIHDWGVKEIIDKTDKAISYIDKKGEE